MGQRLVITIKQNEEEIAKVYYHWSAYSLSALYETRKIIDVLYDDENAEKDLKLRLIRFCESNGGGIDGGEGSEEWKYIMELYPNEEFKKENINRNEGLIALSKTGMKEMQNWSEGSVYIDLDFYEVENYVFSNFEDIDDYNYYRSEWEEDFIEDNFKELTLEDIPEIKVNLSNFSVFDIDNVIRKLQSFDGYLFRNGEEIYEVY